MDKYLPYLHENVVLPLSLICHQTAEVLELSLMCILYRKYNFSRLISVQVGKYSHGVIASAPIVHGISTKHCSGSIKLSGSMQNLTRQQTMPMR